MDFKELLSKNTPIFLDGAMGTMLQKTSLEIGELPELLGITNSETIISIHKSYIEAGSDIIYTNTFGANRYKLKNSGYNVGEVISTAVKNAKKAAEGSSCLVGLDIGPIGQLLEPTGTLTFEEAYDIFKEQITATDEYDVIIFETMSDLYELKAGVLAAKENSDKPIICTMSFEENARTFTGCCVASMAVTLDGLGVDAIGVNCSLGPKELLPIVKEFSRWTNLPLVCKANAGLPDPETGLFSIDAEEFTDYIEKMLGCNVKLIGGCCGTTPEYIKALSSRLSEKCLTKNEADLPPVLCTPTKAVSITEPQIIGERINPTGKKLFKQALKDNNIDYILNQAISQVQAGAEILDVNVGLPEIDEIQMMKRVVKEIQAVTDAPLQIDSTNPEVIENALRIYNGKAIVNSVNGEDEVLDKILPIVKKYGAAVVGLTLDKNGIPPKAEDRFKIAEKILNRATLAGIPKQDVFIDCLTLTVSTEQDKASETLKAVKLVKERLGLKTVLGVSNISFGLPNRELMNPTFLTLALQNGLDLPIINPNIASMSGAVRAYKVLTGIDKDSLSYINAYSTDNTQTTSTAGAANIDIFYAIENGLRKEAEEITVSLLSDTSPMDIINSMLIPALDKAGADFEGGKKFLPQLILSANAAQGAFGVIKETLSRESTDTIDRGKIILATVKGDIHDIGKNIVRVLLENYGYSIIDLGKDVDCSLIAETAIKEDVRLVGLSALMTTTLGAMAETISLIRQSKSDCLVMVGGAVLTEDYAQKIGADFYAKDAKEAVDIAKKVFE